MGGHHQPSANSLNSENLIRDIRNKLGSSCLSKRIDKEGCSLHVNRRLSPYLIADLDASNSPAHQQETRSDYLFFSHGEPELPRFAPIELKSGSPNAKKVIAQLQAGSDVADRIVPPRAKLLFQPVVAYGGEIRKVQLQRLRDSRSRIRFRGCSALPRLLKCGEALASAFEPAK